jgi:curved DNA-binding protein CbpA
MSFFFNCKVMNQQIDPYKVLEVPKNYTMDQLKTNYKRIALQVHPDKGGSAYMFKLVTSCYKTLYNNLKNNNQKEFYHLKGDYKNEVASSYKTAQPIDTAGFSINTGQGFDVQKFNKIFDQVRIQENTDDGYGNWMSKSSKEREDIKIAKAMKKFDSSTFNEIFDNTVKPSKTTKMIVYEEPQGMVSSKMMCYSELGVDKIKDFSGDNMTQKNLNFMDYKVAHTTNRLVDPSVVKARAEYKDLNHVKADRENISFTMTAEDQMKWNKQQALQKEHEEKRLQNLWRRDQEITDHYVKINQLLLQQKQPRKSKR